MRTTLTLIGTLLVLLPCCLLTIGCGENVYLPEGDEPVLTSAIVLADPPEVRIHGRWGGFGFQWDAPSSSFQIYPSTTVDLSGEGIEHMLAATEMVVDSVRYIVYGYLDANDEYQFARIHDTDSDGWPDASSATVFLDTNEEVYVDFLPRLDWRTDGDSEYTPLLDRRCQDIRLARDSDDDGWWDAWLSTPFAKVDDHPELMGVRTILRQNSTGDLVVAASEFDLYRHPVRTLGMGSAHVVLTDTDSDQVADQLTNPAAETARPGVAPPILREGMDAVTVWADHAAGGRTVEVWTIDASGNDLVKLGSVVVAEDRTAYPVALSPALDEDDEVSIRFTTHTERAYTTTVEAAGPTLYAGDPARVDFGAPATTLTVKGHDLPATSELKLYLVRTGETIALTTTFISSTELTATLPTFTSTQVSGGLIQLFVDDEVQGEPIPMQVCEPE